MTTDLDAPPRCPRCGSHDLTVVSIANDPRGVTRLTLTCDACATAHTTERNQP